MSQFDGTNLTIQQGYNMFLLLLPLHEGGAQLLGWPHPAPSAQVIAGSAIQALGSCTIIPKNDRLSVGVGLTTQLAVAVESDVTGPLPARSKPERLQLLPGAGVTAIVGGDACFNIGSRARASRWAPRPDATR